MDTPRKKATFWKDLFERRPDLAPPGYEETVRRIEESRRRKAEQ